MKDTSQAFNNKDSALNEEIRIDTILECLTDQCKDCSGSYINKLFGHKLICACKCHEFKKDRNDNATNNDLISGLVHSKELGITLSKESVEVAIKTKLSVRERD